MIKRTYLLPQFLPSCGQGRRGHGYQDFPTMCTRSTDCFAMTTNIIGTESGISVTALGSSDGASKTAPAIDPAKPFDLYTSSC